LRNLRLDICYDGTRYKGWQRLPGTVNTIQGKLEECLSKILSEPIQITGSGRTDAGVHAQGQTANFFCAGDKSAEEILRELRRYLPEDIGINSCVEVTERFHARLSAKKKTYRYRLWTGDEPCVFDRKYVAFFREPLDEKAMAEAAELLLGRHDFRAFCANSHMKKSTVRTIYDLIDPKVKTDDKGKEYDDNNLVSSAQNHTESQQSFVNGDCVFTFSGSWFGTEMKKILEEVGMTDYHFGAYPVYNAGDKTVLMMNLPGETFFIPSDAVNVSGAKDFLAFVLSEKGVAVAEKALNFPMVYSTDEEVEFDAFGTEIMNLAEKSNLVYRFAKTDVYRTGALELFVAGTSPFISMARNKIARANIEHDVLQTEAVHHQGLWSEWMQRI